MTGLKPEKPDLATAAEFEEFKAASTQFAKSAGELMAATVRMQLLVLDDTRLVLSEFAEIVSGTVRDRRD